MRPRRVLVTVGSQTPFDRLVRAMQAWAVAHPEAAVRAQVGRTALAPAELAPLAWAPVWPAPAYAQALDWAEVVVGHAGMGTVMAAFEAGRPLVVLPRRAAHRETRNDHQLGTARVLRDRPAVWVVDPAPGTTPEAAADLLSGLSDAIEAALRHAAGDTGQHPADSPDTAGPAPSNAAGVRNRPGAAPPDARQQLIGHLRQVLSGLGAVGRARRFERPGFDPPKWGG